MDGARCAHVCTSFCAELPDYEGLTMTEPWPSRVSFARLALRPCSPLLSDAGSLQRVRSQGVLGSRASRAFFAEKLRTPAAGVQSENHRAQSRAAELERFFGSTWSNQTEVDMLKSNSSPSFPEFADFESGGLKEQFDQATCFSFNVLHVLSQKLDVPSV